MFVSSYKGQDPIKAAAAADPRLRAARYGTGCPRPETPFPPLTINCQQKQGGTREELQVTTFFPPASLPPAVSTMRYSGHKPQQYFSRAQPCPSVPSLRGSGSSSTNTLGFVCVPGVASLQMRQMTCHRTARSSLPQVAGRTDAQSPSNKSSRSKSTMARAWNNRGKAKRSLLQAEFRGFLFA